MDPHHRKIDLQSPADLTYLHNNIKNGAQQKLDLAIPPQGEDVFRTKVQEFVQEVSTPPEQSFLSSEQCHNEEQTRQKLTNR